MRRAALNALVLVVLLTTLARSLPNDAPALQSRPGTGMFLLLSDIHFDPYADPAILKQLGVNPLPACHAPASGAFSKFGSDSNYPLLKSALENAAATAAANHFHYEYVIVTGDFLAHKFDTRFVQCVGEGKDAYRKFSSDTIAFVDGMIAKALPGVPVFAGLGNNDSDKGDYDPPSSHFLRSVGKNWSAAWGNLPTAAREKALASFEHGGYYTVPHPTVAKNELVILNANLWSTNDARACSDSEPDPGGQFQWLEAVLGQARHDGATATLVMHILPGVDAINYSMGKPRTFWTDRCTDKFIAQLTAFHGTVREIYAGHIHRDDFRILPDAQGKPLAAIHILPAISPVYLDNPAVEVGWYDKQSGELRDYAPLYLNLTQPHPAWATEYVFSRAYGHSRPNLAALKELTKAIRAGTPQAGVGKAYADHYAVEAGPFVTPDNWFLYSCAQTEITLARYKQCLQASAHHKP